jgi:hypothetical protein
MRRVLATLALAFLAGCGGCASLTPVAGPLGEPVVPGAVQFEPFPMYRVWWALAEHCTHEVGDFDRYTFYYVPGWHLDNPNDPFLAGHNILGVTVIDGGRHEIYLPEMAVMRQDVVEHEFIHALGFGPEHSYRIFVTQCHVENDTTITWQYKPVP